MWWCVKPTTAVCEYDYLPTEVRRGRHLCFTRTSSSLQRNDRLPYRRQPHVEEHYLLNSFGLSGTPLR